jgi:diaminopimelate epimerase
MKIPFYKYHGTGNDFILLDNRTLLFPKTAHEWIAQLCHRNFGIGADGLILLEENTVGQYNMVYYNSDGNLSSMCGNGGRCFVAFAKYLGLIENEMHFDAPDGAHFAQFTASGEIALQMKSVNEVVVHPDYVFLNTGSPHHVQLVNDLPNFLVVQNGSAIRYGDLYGTAGSNVNFVEPVSPNTFAVRTYERGVENETLSCGTGVTAVAIAMHKLQLATANTVQLQTPGGNLWVSFDENEGKYQQVILTGPAQFVFAGELDWAE